MGNKVKIFEITPSSNSSFDYVVIRADADKTWKTVLEEVERVLDDQWNQVENGDMKWREMHVTVKASEIDEEDLKE